MRLRKPLVILLLLVLGGGLLVQFYLPSWVEVQMAGGIGAAVHSSLVDVDAVSTPSLKMLLGDFDLLRVDARQAQIGALNISGFLFDAKGVGVDPLDLLVNHKLSFRYVRRLNATLLLTEDSLNSYFKEISKKGTPPKVQLLEDRVVSTASVALLGMPLTVKVEGHFVLDEEAQVVRFAPDRVVVGKSSLPPMWLELLKGEISLPLEIQDLPVPVRITSIRLEKGRLYLFGEGGTR